MQIPYDVEVVWNLKSSDFSYARFNIDEIKYKSLSNNLIKGMEL